MKKDKNKSIRFFEYILFYCFLLVSLLSVFIPYFKLDLVISKNIQDIQSLIFKNLMWTISSIGNQPYMVILVGITSVLLYISKQKVESVFCLLSSTTGALVGTIFKILIDRPRPTSELVRVSVWLSDKSYPSNHVLVFTIFFGFIFYLLFKKTKHKLSEIIIILSLFLLLLSIGLSRIYLGVHWASDVLGGYLLGTMWLIFTIRLYNSYNGKR